MRTAIFPPIHLLFALILLFTSFNSYAAQWYHVELIVFEQLSSVTDERWPELNVRRGSLSPAESNGFIQPARTNALAAVSSRLSASPKYRVHYHRAWSQPIMKKSRAKSVNIISGNNQIEGSLRLYKSTYLYAAANLWLKNGAGTPNLKEVRRIRSNKLYFFDHPKMGAILQLTPIKAQAAAVEPDKLETFSLTEE